MIRSGQRTILKSHGEGTKILTSLEVNKLITTMLVRSDLKRERREGEKNRYTERERGR